MTGAKPGDAEEPAVMRAVDSAAERPDDVGIRLPPDLERRLYAFRGLVRRIKIVEAVAGAACGVVCGYLAVFCLDRVMETQKINR